MVSLVLETYGSEWSYTIESVKTKKGGKKTTIWVEKRVNENEVHLFNEVYMQLLMFKRN